MNRSTPKPTTNPQEIAGVAVTGQILTSRAGLTLFVRYLGSIGISVHLTRLFGCLRRNAKGVGIADMFRQLFCYFLDGTSRHLARFDQLKKDGGYAATLETVKERLASSFAVGRFFKSFSFGKANQFRQLLRQMFLWRLNLAKPAVVILGLDTMVLNNDEALRRDGVKPTYKKVKGFQPLQMTWGRHVVDAIFRSGDKHSNHGDDVVKMVRTVVENIRRHYRSDVAIIIRMDSGFYDQKVFAALEQLGIGYIIGGKMYGEIREYMRGVVPAGWQEYRDGRSNRWEYVEFGDRRKSWRQFRRAIFMRLRANASGQQRLEFARPDTVVYTNLGRGGAIDGLLKKAGRPDMLESDFIVAEYHRRGGDELVHRALKDFAAEELPFQRFAPNAAYYYCMLAAFFLYETFKEDVCGEVVPLSAYPTTLRRSVLDVAAKIVKHAGQTIMKITAAVMESLNFNELWRKSAEAPLFAWR